jgi:hypothetical protein
MPSMRLWVHHLLWLLAAGTLMTTIPQPNLGRRALFTNDVQLITYSCWGARAAAACNGTGASA